MVMATWLASVLRAAGLAVEEAPGWQTRGRGEMTAVQGVLVHHTAGPPTGDRPSLALVRDGRKDLAGPLSQLFLTRAGVFVVLAAGRCNHAGEGRWQGIVAGNSRFIGIEAENTGTLLDPWPDAQMEALIHGCAAIAEHIGADDVMIAGHREYALPRGRKIDPLFDMVHFRQEVATVMWGDRPAVHQITPVPPSRLMLRKGDQGESVKLLQRLLGIAIDGAFGPKTEAAVRAFQEKFELVVDGRVGPKTWEALEG